MNHTTNEHEEPNYRCDCKPTNAIPFLDTMCSIQHGKIDIDLHKKETDCNQYLLPSSCHPAQTTKYIPYSLSLRIVRVCNNPKNRYIRLQELKQDLLERNYNESAIDRAIERVIKVPRNVALRRVIRKEKEKGPILVHTYDQRLPSFSQIQSKH